MSRTTMLEKFYTERRPWLDVMANDSFILANCRQPVCLAHLEDACSGLDLLIAPDYQNAWQEFVALNPDYNDTANRNCAFQWLHEGLLVPSVDNLCDCLDDPKTPLRPNAQACAAAQRNAERQQLINFIGKESPHYWNIPLDDFKAIAENVRFARLPKEETRAELRATTKANFDALTNPAKPPLPATYRVTVPNKHFPQPYEVIELTRANFMRLEKQDIRILINGHGSQAIDEMLGVVPRAQVGTTVRINL